MMKQAGIRIEKSADEYKVDNGLVCAEAALKDGTLTLRWSAGESISDLFAEAVCGGERLRSTLYGRHLVNEALAQPLDDSFGRGVSWAYEHHEQGKPVLRQRIRMYDNLPYLFIELEAEHDREWETNELTPLAAYVNDGSVVRFAGDKVGGETRALFIPFDNDKWVRFASRALPCSVTSYEATAIYRSEGRDGFVLGSVTHQIWKTGLTVEGSSKTEVSRLRAYGGAADMQTRDTVPHGSIRGAKLVSPTLFVGAFPDYRDGLEAYGRANAALAPALPHDGGVPVGWNSWSAAMTKLDFDIYAHTSDFFRKELQPHGFADDEGSLYVNFDSFWSNLSQEQLHEAVVRVKENGQKPGIYYTPFAFWGNDPDRPVEGTDGTVSYREILLKDTAGNLLPRLAGAYAIDPTHPAALERIGRMLDRFVEWGFDYVKLDFLTHGAREGVFHDPAVRTGIQAYNKGMAYICELLNPQRIGRPFLVNLSIAPLFPHGYAHSRRMSCDVFGTIDDTEYALNSLTYGWWINDSLYRFNDPDHVVLYRSVNQRSVTEQEGRSRLNSAVIAGTSLLLGDDYRIGEAARRAKEWMTNREVMSLARRGESFRPVEGRSDNRSEDLFVLDGEEGTWLAIFNFDGASDAVKEISLARAGIDCSGGLLARDLWSGSESVIPAGADRHRIVLGPSESALLLFRPL